MFDGIAPEYDTFNHVTSLDIDKRWRRKAVRELIDRQNLNVLDVACGTGDFALAMAEAMTKMGGTSRAAAHITGLDLSEGMLNVMKQKVEKAGYQDIISQEQGDCEALKFLDNTFDRISVAFGVRNFEDRAKGIREMLRVLKPDGRLVILELSMPDNKIVRWLFNIYFFHIMPIFGGHLSGNKSAYKYLPASVFNFPRRRAFTEELLSCGARTVRHHALTLGICRMYVVEK